MSVAENGVHPTLIDLAHAAKSWIETDDGRPLSRWLRRELDADGVPIRLPVPDWPRCLEILNAAKPDGGDGPSGRDEAIAGLVLAALRFARPDGSPALHEDGDANGRIPPAWMHADWMGRFRDTGIARVLGWWFDRGPRSRSTKVVPPPLPTWSAPNRVLATLRPDWLPGGDFLAVDHRDPHSPCRFELFGNGRTWLGPVWPEGVGGACEPIARPRPSRWFTGAAADLIEWGYRVDRARVTRSALLLRGRRLAMLSALVEGRESSWDVDPELRLAIPSGVTAGPIRSSRALVLREPGRRGAAQVVPIALPCRPYPTERGAFRTDDRRLILRQAPSGRKCWLPLLVSWDGERHRKALDWRVLTVSERSRPVPPGRAFAARVSWGQQETYVVYRSLGPPALRAFLGHQTAARFLFAEFTEDGELKPIFAVE